MHFRIGMAALILISGGSMFSSVMAIELSQEAAQEAIQVLRAVQPQSKGSAEARQAVQSLVQNGPASLLPVLKGCRDATPLAANWLRTVFEQIAEQQLAKEETLPEPELLAFVMDTNESPGARRLAYEWIIRQRPAAEQELIPQLLLDPAPEFRRDAVAMLMTSAARTGDKSESAELYQKALKGAVHEDQVKAVAAALREKGQTVDIRRHLGFLSNWNVIGPFDNKDQKGYAVSYPPETAIDLNAEYAGQLGPVKWKPLSTDDDFGRVDIATQIENYKGSLMYVTTAINCPGEQALELRLGTPNAWKLWVNGQLVFEREEYHRSSHMDQYRVPVNLKSGPNTILLKVCQNEQTQDWAQKYEFQLRVCDATGAGAAPNTETASADVLLNGAN